MKYSINVEIFSCSGGMAEGFRRAGIPFQWLFDKDPNACASYTANLGHAPVQMDVRDLLRMVRGGWRPGLVRLLVADPPCTPWSRAGKREGTADERDMLTDTAELIGLLRPLAYVIGNVPGLDDATNWPVVQSVIGGLRSHGYCTNDYASLDAADFGVPQHRVRPFWFGHLAGPCVRWPLPTHGPPGQPALPGLGLKPWATCRDALQHLPAELLGRPVRIRKQHPDHNLSRRLGPGKTITRNTHGDGTVLLNPRHPPAHPAHPAHPARTLGAKDRGQSTVLEWPWDRPATTVFAEGRIAPPGHHDGSNLSGTNAVVLSEKAAALLQGFPDAWVFAGKTKAARWSQLGQAMPPALAEAVARSVAEQLEAARV